MSNGRMAAAAPDRSWTFDLLRMPLVGRFLRWRRSRLVMQIPVLLVGLVMILHAFWGPELAPKNLATLLTWVHFRGAVVLVILFAGNFFCMACPFMLPRELARRFVSPRWQWPRALRTKWPAILLFVAVLFVYELFDAWSSPVLTGSLIVAYFATATAVDALFKNASFCKYVCPIGQFNFLGSTVSPLEVAVRSADVCDTCRTKDCIRGVRGDPSRSGGGHAAPLPVLQRGCELALFLPRKVGNLDCTFCLDCVYACPHDNIAIAARLPGHELTVDANRSGIRKLHRRSDWTLLTIVFTFGAVLNAFAMISPVYALEQWIAGLTHLRVEWPILSALFVVALVIEPVLLLGSAALVSRRLSHSARSILAEVNHYARSLIPIGFGIWLAHYGFHFFTGALTLIPVVQHAVIDATGTALLGAPQWQLGGLPPAIVFPLEVGFLTLGLLGSWSVAWSVSRPATPSLTWRAFLPWSVVHGLLFVAAVWIMTQPMEMRGTFLGG